MLVDAVYMYLEICCMAVKGHMSELTHLNCRDGLTPLSIKTLVKKALNAFTHFDL